MYRKPLALLFILLIAPVVCAKDLAGKSHAPRGWTVADKAQGLIQYSIRCKSATKSKSKSKTQSKVACPVVTAKRERTSEKRKKAYLDQIIVEYLDRAYTQSRHDVDFKILRLGETDLVQVSSQLGERRQEAIIAVDEDYIRYYELDAHHNMFTQHNKDFYSYWRRDLGNTAQGVLAQTGK